MQVVLISVPKTGKHRLAFRYFVAIDLFNGKKLESIVPLIRYCQVSPPFLCGFLLMLGNYVPL